MKLRPLQAKQYRHALYTASLSGKSINTMMGTLRTFYEYLMEEERIRGNPVLKNLRVREEPRYPVPLSEEEQRVILEALESKEEYIRLAFKTMISTGIRVGEAARLTKKDVRLENKKLVLFVRKAKGASPGWLLLSILQRPENYMIMQELFRMESHCSEWREERCTQSSIFHEGCKME